jgi:hypothetical protein
MNKFIVFSLITGMLSVAGFAGGEEVLFEYPSDVDRDPFNPLVNADGMLNIRLVRQEGDLALNGVLYSPTRDQRMAIINGEMLREDDSIGSYIIETIAQDSVVLVKESKKITLRMGGEDEQ